MGGWEAREGWMVEKEERRKSHKSGNKTNRTFSDTLKQLHDEGLPSFVDIS